MTDDNTQDVTEEEIKIRAAFDDNQGQDEEIVKMAMLQSGCKIKAVTRLYNQFMIDSGLMASKEEKDEVLDRILADLDLTDEDTFSGAVEAVAAEVTGATESSAATLIRAYCRREEVECWKKPIGESRRSGFRFKFYDALIANPAMSSVQLKELCGEFGSDNDKKAISHYQAIRELINTISGNTQAEAA